MSPFIISLLLLAVMAGIVLLFLLRPTPPNNLYAVFDTTEDPALFEHQVRSGIACAAEMNAIPVLLLSTDHPAELDDMLRIIQRETPVSVLNSELFENVV